MLELPHKCLTNITESCEEREIRGNSSTWHLLDQVNNSVICSTMEQYLFTIYLDMLHSLEINGASLSAPQSLFKTMSYSIPTLQEIDALFILSRLHKQEDNKRLRFSIPQKCCYSTPFIPLCWEAAVQCNHSLCEQFSVLLCFENSLDFISVVEL